MNTDSHGKNYKAFKLQIPHTSIDPKVPQDLWDLESKTIVVVPNTRATKMDFSFYNVFLLKKNIGLAIYIYEWQYFLSLCVTYCHLLHGWSSFYTSVERSEMTIFSPFFFFFPWFCCSPLERDLCVVLSSFSSCFPFLGTYSLKSHLLFLLI